MRRFTLAAVMLMVFTVGALGQETRDTFRLREIVVSAARLPIERAALAASVSVLEGTELRQKGIRNVADALRTVAGAALAQGGSYGAPASLFMRGGESDYVQVLIDGVQVNSPGEIFDFASLTLENVERIEIVRGPSSVLFGSDAVTGLVNVITKAGSRRTQFGLAANGGTRESAAFDANMSGGSARALYGVGVSYFRTDGTYAFNNQHRNAGVTGRIGFMPDANSEVRATLRYNRNTFHYPTDGAGNLVDANQYHVADAVTVGIEAARRLTPRLEARAQVGFNRNEDHYDDAPDDARDTTGFYAFYSGERFQRESADLRLNYAFAPGSTITFGGEYEQQRERGWNLSESDFGPFEASSREQRHNRAGYAQLVSAVGRANLQGGVRFEDNERFGSFSTYRGGISLPLGSFLRLRASAGTGFKEPRFYEQFASGYVNGNPALEPETSRSAEAGIELARGTSRLSVTSFAQRFRNLIQYVNRPFGSTETNYLNLAGARADGIEIEAAHAVGALSLRGALTLLDTGVTDQGTGEDPLFVNGERLIRRPARTASLTAAYTERAVALSVSAHYVGTRDDLNFSGFPAERVELDAYTRVDVAAELPLMSSGVRATLKLENALNAGYQEVFNFPARGRMIFAGLRYGR